MDRISRFLLAVIAVSLAAIAAKLWHPAEAHAQAFLSSAPTVGEFQDAKSGDDKTRLLRRIPVVKVYGAN
jgi:hypothetical protein